MPWLDPVISARFPDKLNISSDIAFSFGAFLIQALVYGETSSGETRMLHSCSSIVIHAAGDLRIEPQELATPGAGEVLIQMQAGGICGSDLHYYHNGGFGPIKLREPMVLGHEVSGIIRALGTDTGDLQEGQLVAISPSRPCHSCAFCTKGQHNHCLNMRFYGSAMPFPHIQGAFQEHLVVSAAQCAPADGLSAAQAAMAEPLAVCLHAVAQAGDLTGKTVLITGCGPIGALCILAARHAGAARVIATDLSDYTLTMAQLCGADTPLNTAINPQALEEFQAASPSIQNSLVGSSDVISPLKCYIKNANFRNLGFWFGSSFWIRSSLMARMLSGSLYSNLAHVCSQVIMNSWVSIPVFMFREL